LKSCPLIPQIHLGFVGIFEPMKLFRYIKQLCASLLIPVVFLLIIFSTGEPSETKTRATKPTIHLSQVSAIAMREHTGGDYVTQVRIPDFIEVNWQQASLQLALEVNQHAALQIPAHVFNVFYSVVTINAP